MFEEAAEGMLVTDPQEQLVAANLPAINLVGYSREELIGRVAADLIPSTYPAPSAVPEGGQNSVPSGQNDVPSRVPWWQNGVPSESNSLRL